MKKSTKQAVSIVLVFIIALSCFGTMAFAESSKVFTTAIPTVYVAGQGTNLYKDNADGSTDKFYPFVVPDGYLGDWGKKLIKPLYNGIIKDEWDEYCSILTDGINGIMAPVGLNNDGEAYEGQRSWKNAPKNNLADENGRYPLYTHGGSVGYYFNYDWRLDPSHIADLLNEYIEQVKATTKIEKVNIIGRCLGANVVLAYLYKYGSDSIEKTILYSAGLENFKIMGCLFSGQIEFDPNGLSAFLNNYIESSDYADDPLVGFAQIIVELMDYTSLLGIPLNYVDSLWQNIYQKVLPEVLISTYASMPSFWAFVGDDYFEAAKQFVFAGKEDEYAKLIEKIDAYHSTIGSSTVEIIENANGSNNPVSIISKYGLQMLPVMDDADVMSDSLLETSSSSLGATCAPINGKLSKSYIAEAEEKGTDKFISSDSLIDASTALIPDRTWFVKNVQHMSAPSCVNELISAILDYDGVMTVFDNENLPQFLEYDSGKEIISPVQAQNSSIDKLLYNIKYSKWIDILLKVIKTFINAIAKLVK